MGGFCPSGNVDEDLILGLIEGDEKLARRKYKAHQPSKKQCFQNTLLFAAELFSLQKSAFENTRNVKVL